MRTLVWMVGIGIMLVGSSSFAQSKFAGTYTGAVSPTRCKNGFAAEDGPLTFTVDANGSVDGTLHNSFGLGVMSGTVTSKGRIVGFTFDSTGQSGPVKGRIDATGQFKGKAKTGVCKFTVVGLRN